MRSLRRFAAGLAMFSAVAVVPVMGASSASAGSTPQCAPVSPHVTYAPLYMGQTPHPQSPNWVFGPNCDYDSYHGSVKVLQSKLGITADGIFGPATRAAVMAFQRSHGLVVDGIAGDKTLAALGIIPEPFARP